MKADVVVVGGGPSGAVCARELAQLGYSVILIERANMPRNKVCGEYLNCGSLQQVEELGLLNSLPAEAHLLRGLRLSSAGKSLQLHFPKPAMALARSIFDSMLMDAARASGVQVIHGRVNGVRFRDGNVCGVQYESDDVVHDVGARYTIGADGCGSIVARKLELTKRIRSNVRYAMGGHFEAKASDLLEMHVDKGTYLASNPLSDHHANVMFIAPKSVISASAGDSDAWFRRMANAMMPEAAFDIERRLGKSVAFGPLTHRVTAAASHKVLLVGDAAGFISPFTGQGIFIALSSARAAAAAVHAAMGNPSREKHAFFVYDRMQRRDRRARSGLSALLDILAHAPFMAHRVMRRVEMDERLRENLLNLFCGLEPPNFIRGTRLLFGAI